MWKVSFKDSMHKQVERFNDKVTVVTLKGELSIPKEIMMSLPKSIFNWIQKKTNPKVKILVYGNTMILTAKGRAIKSDEDEDNPVLAEKIAECRAKATIYKFVANLADRCIAYYVNLLVGKNLEGNFTVIKGNSIYAVANRYSELCYKKSMHLSELLGLKN